MCRLCYRTDTWQELCKVSFRCPKTHQVNAHGKCSFLTVTAALGASPICSSASIHAAFVAVGIFSEVWKEAHGLQGAAAPAVGWGSRTAGSGLAEMGSAEWGLSRLSACSFLWSTLFNSAVPV